MKVRTLIPKRLDPMDDPAHATVIANLVSAGFRLLGPDELDALEAEWTRPDAMRLRGGEMTPQEIRTAQAFVRGFVAELRTLTTGGKNGR